MPPGASWRELEARHPRRPDGGGGRGNGLLRMGELAEASGVPAATIKHYLREGLLPEPVKTSRNMAYYPPEFVERIRLIKQLQEERFMPLRAIKSVLDEDPAAGPGAGRARGPDPRPGAGGRADADQRRRGARALRGPEGGPRPPRGARGAEPEQPRLLALRREDHRGDQPLPRRRLRRGDRLHRLRHAALQERPRGARAPGGRGADGPPRRRDGSRRASSR